jgi:broad specificity phosphatase PhoE
MRIALLRHGPTEWNEEGRIQGRLDMPLSAAGREKMAALAPPKGFENARAFSSPLSRARETAELLGLRDVTVDARLSEHNWAQWEGLTRAEILTRDGEDAFERAGKGIDFTPLGGERTADLVARVRAFLVDVAAEDSPAIAVAHRGVLRSAYAIATNWQMLTPMPDALDLSKVLVLEVSAAGDVATAQLNVELRPKSK